MEHYELLRTEALAMGSSLVGVIRRLLEERRMRLRPEPRRDYKKDPLYARRGSFVGPPTLAEYHERHLYGRGP